LTRSDAVVVGAGHNGLVAAILLAKAGWSVTVVERADEPGGAVRTAEVTLPGFKHDLYATNLNLFVGSPFFAEYGQELAAHGFAAAGTDKPFGSLFPGGGFLGVSTDAAATLERIRAVSAADAESWQRLGAWFGKVAPTMFGVLGSPLPSAAALRALWSERGAVREEWAELARVVLQSPREFAEENFSDPRMQALVGSWGMHLDFGPDVPGGATFPLLETCASAQNGIALGAGGARTMIDALVSLLRSLGGELRTGAEVEEIVVSGGRATGVALAGGERIEAARAVVANVTPTVLFGGLVREEALDPEFLRKARRYRYGPGTLMLHLALDELPDWIAGPEPREWCYLHIGPYLDDMGLAYAQASAGLLPERPTLVVGQPTAVDPSRAPEGKHILWVQVRVVPGRIRGDAAREIEATDWDEVKDPYAERVLDLLSEHAPSLRDHVLGKYVMSPVDLERANPNLVGGDQVAGSHHPAQHYIFRPIPGWSRYTTPIDALHMCGAGTWPGAGVGAGSGFLLGKQLTRERKLPSLRRARRT
jgi:phytoene dehydrogenase-like protein